MLLSTCLWAYAFAHIFLAISHWYSELALKNDLPLKRKVKIQCPKRYRKPEIMPISYAYHTYIICISYGYHTHMIRISCAYPTHIICISSSYHTHIICISYAYHMHIICQIDHWVHRKCLYPARDHTEYTPFWWFKWVPQTNPQR